MARMKLDFPKKFDFATDIQVQIANINYGGHLGNDSLLSLIHEARIRFLEAHGFTERDIGGAGIIMVDTVVLYKSESFHGDVLTFQVAVQDVSRVGCNFVYRETNKATNKDVAHAKTGVVFFDYHERKVVNIPQSFVRLFG
ncbi:MAG: thioesterase family protein [candidate division WOR-3 bacterium]|nr:MAG: thioesterase family protein [candidate division WOR-3 bacterium]